MIQCVYSHDYLVPQYHSNKVAGMGRGLGGGGGMCNKWLFSITFHITLCMSICNVWEEQSMAAASLVLSGLLGRHPVARHCHFRSF